MENVFFFLLCFLAIAFAFYGGIILGIADCKRRFGIPKQAIGVDDNGYIYS